jgi:hypothetical protein
MTKIIACITTAVLTFASAAAQPTYIGVEVANGTDISRFDDQAGYIQPSQLLDAGILGIKVRHVVAEPLFLETGLYTREYKIGFKYKNRFETGGTGRRAYLLPLRAGLRIPLFNKHLYISPVGGLVMATTDNQEGGEGYGSWTEPSGDKLEYYYTIRYPVQTYFLLQGGMSIDIRLFRKAFLSVMANYYAGMNKLWVQDIDYTINGIEYNATGYVKGSCSSFGIGLSYQINAERIAGRKK